MDQIFDMEKVMSFFNYVYYFFILNLLFLLSNSPFLGFYFLLGISSIDELLPLFLLCLLPLAPSLCALFYCMNKLIINKDIYPCREYITGYKSNFKQSIVIGFMQLICVFIICISMRVLASIPQLTIFSFILLVELALIILMTPFLYLFASRYTMKSIAIIKVSIITVFGKPLYALGNVIVFLFMLMLFEIIAGTTFLFIGVVYSFLIVLSNKKLFCILES